MQVRRSKVSARGWVVIPKGIRERHGIKPGDEVLVMEDCGQILLVPIPADPLAALQGMFAHGPSLTEALLEERRMEREREDAKMARWSREQSTRSHSRGEERRTP